MTRAQKLIRQYGFLIFIIAIVKDTSAENFILRKRERLYLFAALLNLPHAGDRKYTRFFLSVAKMFSLFRNHQFADTTLQNDDCEIKKKHSCEFLYIASRFCNRLL